MNSDTRKFVPILRTATITVAGGTGFHRCSLCGEYPELQGSVAIMAGGGDRSYTYGICERCVERMHATLDRARKERDAGVPCDLDEEERAR